MPIPFCAAGFSDNALANLQRSFADLGSEKATAPPPPRPGKQMAIIDGGRVTALLRRRRMTVEQLGAAARLGRWRRQILRDLIDYGEVTLSEATAIARVLGATLDDIAMGWRTL